MFRTQLPASANHPLTEVGRYHDRPETSPSGSRIRGPTNCQSLACPIAAPFAAGVGSRPACRRGQAPTQAARQVDGTAEVAVNLPKPVSRQVFHLASSRRVSRSRSIGSGGQEHHVEAWKTALIAAAWTIRCTNSRGSLNDSSSWRPFACTCVIQLGPCPEIVGTKRSISPTGTTSRPHAASASSSASQDV